MRWVKLATSALVLGLIGLFIYQNLATFNSEVVFGIDLQVAEPMKWSIYVYTLIAIAAGFGFLAGLLLMFKPYRGARRTLKDERQERLAEQMAPKPEPTPAVQPEQPSEPEELL